LEPENFTWVYYQGVALIFASESEAALEVLQEALDRRPDYAPLRLQLGSLFLARGDTENAELHYRAALERDPTSAIPYFGLGQVLKTQGQLEAAAVQYRKALSLAPRFGSAHYAIALTYRDLGIQERASHHLELSERHEKTQPPVRDPLLAAVIDLEESATRYRHRAREHASKGRNDAALRDLLKALEFDSESVLVHVDLAQNYSAVGRPGKAEEHYRAALGINPNAQSARFSYSRFLIQQARLSEAAEVIQELLKINPHSAQAHVRMGSVLDQQGSREGAMRHYRIALENDPKMPQANYLVALHLIAGGDLVGAESHLEKALQIDEAAQGVLQYEIGLAFGQSGYPDKAIAYLEQARQSAIQTGRQPLLAKVKQSIDELSLEAEAQ
jgi:tetratricopeptide (TPR) repeat protein